MSKINYKLTNNKKIVVKTSYVLYNIVVKKKKSYIIIAIVIIVGLVLDLVTKLFFAQYFAGGKNDIIVIPEFFRFTFTKNTGAAYGMFGNSTLGLTIISALFIVAFCVYDYFNHSDSIWYCLGISFIVSGALGNLVDRIFLGYVRDFISINLFNFVFNIADALITFGVIFFVVHLIVGIITEQKEKNKNELDNK